jgi:hypothetical protein
MHFLIIRLLDQLDRGELYLSNSILFLLVFNAICIAVIVYSTLTKTWTKTFAENEAARPNDNYSGSAPNSQIDTSPLISALGVLILDFVKEREWKRQQQEGKASNGDSNRSDQ